MAKFDSDWVPQSAMTIFAHPDDAEFSCSGTVARWARTGCDITYVLITSGNAGTHDTSYTPESLMEVREREQHNACAVLGVKHIEFLRHDDGRVVADLNLRRELVRLIRQYKPEVVFCNDPTQVFWLNNRINHPDHRAAGLAAIDAVFPASEMELLWPEDGPAWKVHGVYVRTTGEVNTWIDISDTIDLKVKALREHHSQLDDYKELEETIRQRAAEAGQEQGMVFAESFRVVRLKE